MNINEFYKANSFTDKKYHYMLFIGFVGMIFYLSSYTLIFLYFAMLFIYIFKNILMLFLQMFLIKINLIEDKDIQLKNLYSKKVAVIGGLIFFKF